MIYKYSDMPKVKAPAVLYSIELYFEATDKDIIDLQNAYKYARKKNPHISWFIADSDTDSKTAFKVIERTGKQGKQKIVVYGDKVPRHIHTGVMGNEEKSAWKVAEHIRVSMNKKKGKKIARVVSMQGVGFIRYSCMQANHFYKGGDFDFSFAESDFYIEE